MLSKLMWSLFYSFYRGVVGRERKRETNCGIFGGQGSGNVLVSRFEEKICETRPEMRGLKKSSQMSAGISALRHLLRRLETV